MILVARRAEVLDEAVAALGGAAYAVAVPGDLADPELAGRPANARWPRTGGWTAH